MANYYVLLTDYGKQVIANAHTTTPIQLVSVVLGDANNQPYLPESRLGETGLVHETARVPVTRLKIVDDTTVEVTAIVASDIGGFNIHEIGIVDITGKLVYVGNFHGGYRPLLTEGAGGDMELVFSITANNLAQVLIEVDPTVVTASKAWVNERFALLFYALFPMGYKYWSHVATNPKPLFDALFGYETFWRRLEGVQLVAVQDSDAYINQPMQYLGQKGLTDAAISQRPQAYPLYTSYLFERYDPATVIETVWRVTANKAAVNEGDGLLFTLTANNIPDGQIIPYAIVEGELNSDGSDITNPENSATGSVTLKNGAAEISYQTTAFDNTAEPQKHVRIAFFAPANVALNIPVSDAGYTETVIHISQSNYDGIVLDEYYKQQSGSYPSSTDTVRFIVDSGVDIVAPDTLRGAIESGSNWPSGSQIIVENHGRILGRGGDGGRSAYIPKFAIDNAFYFPSSESSVVPPEKGKNGGTAIIATNPIKLENYSLVSGGGGGGGGLGLYKASSYNMYIGGGGSGGGAPLGLRSPNESTYPMYVIDDTISWKKLDRPSSPILSLAYQTTFRASGETLDHSSESSTVYMYDDSYMVDSTDKSRGIFFPLASNSAYADGLYRKYYVLAGGFAETGGDYNLSIPLSMSTDATVDNNGLGGSNILARPSSDAKLIKTSTTGITSPIDAQQGGDGGLIGENGGSGVFKNYYTYLNGEVVDAATNTDFNIYVPSASGGLAGYIYQGNVTINNLSSGTTKGRTPI